MADEKPIGVDVPGFSVLKDAVLALLNEYPGLNGRTITYSGLSEDDGISLEAESGALVYINQPDILGGIHQQCQFPFYVVRRGDTSTEYQKLRATEFLDNLGAWLCREPVTINGVEHRLTEYPPLTGGRAIVKAERSNTYGLEPNKNNTQDWVIPVTVYYTHDFMKP